MPGVGHAGLDEVVGDGVSAYLSNNSDMPAPSSPAAALIKATETLCAQVELLRFAAPVHTVYNPLRYAEAMHRAYIERFAHTGIDVLFLGMNPGPFGMTQTGIPFGEISSVRDWMQLSEPIGKPAVEHPKRPIEGLACGKSEVSGKRLWGLFKYRFNTPEAFFATHYVANYCPLVFMEDGGGNLTPDTLPAAEQRAIEAACDAHLIALVKALKPTWVIGVGAFAKKRAEDALKAAKLTKIRVGTILHPSPASPAANRDWAGQATKQLMELGIWM